MNKSELTATIADALGMTKTDVFKVIDQIPRTIAKELKRGNKVQVFGLGSFEVRSARRARAAIPPPVMGLQRQPQQRAFFAIVWSHADACVVMAVVRLHTEDMQEIFVGKEIDPRWFGVDRFEEQTRVAKAIADHYARGIVFPPYEVVIRWLTPGGKPINRVKRLNAIVGYECNSLTEQHRTEISNYALTLAGQNAAITVTIRNAKRRHLIADEFVVDSGIDPLQHRWMEPVENYQS